MGKYPFAGVEFASQCFCGTEINPKAKTGKCATGLLTPAGPKVPDAGIRGPRRVFSGFECVREGSARSCEGVS